MTSEEKVIIQHLQSTGFIERWIQKSHQYSNEKLEDVFDKFFTLFVVFNRLYNDAKSLIEAKGETEKMINDAFYKAEFIKSKNIGDQKASTVCVAYILRSKASEIVKENAEQISTLLKIIPEFNICLKNGEPQKDKDSELLKNLASKEDQVVLLTLLKTLYQIRCNTFHGEKEMIPRQQNLLITINSFLTNIIVRLPAEFSFKAKDK